jgi:hypothetical protein
MPSQKATDGVVRRADEREVLLKTKGADKIVPSWLLPDVRPGDRVILTALILERGVGAVRTGGGGEDKR